MNKSNNESNSKSNNLWYINTAAYVKVNIAFLIAQVLYVISKTTFAPLISAIVLPVMMQTACFVYTIAAFFVIVGDIIIT